MKVSSECISLVKNMDASRSNEGRAFATQKNEQDEWRAKKKWLEVYIAHAYQIVVGAPDPRRWRTCRE
jgi:hypothetical protein